MIKGTKVRAATFIAVSGLLLAGCGGASESEPQPGSEVGVAGAEGGTLTVTTGQGAIPQLDPGLATFQWERVLYPLLWDGLTDTDSEGNIVPALAESWEANEDYTEWTFVLQKGITYSNGEEITAEDIVWNVERVMEGNASLAAKYLASVEEVEAQGDSEVHFVLADSDSVLPHGLTALRIIDPDNEDEINTTPVSTGPFEVSNFVPDQRLEMVRNDNYWGEQPALDGITIETTNDTSAAVTALRSGDVQVLWNLPAADSQPLESDPAIELLEAEESTQLHFISMDTTTPPFDDPKAREALSLVLDRGSAVDVAFSGFGEAAMFNELVPQASWAFDDSALESQEVDLERAAQLFEEAGVSEGDTLTWWGLAGAYPEWNREAQLLQENLAEIGINLKIENQETGTWVDKFVPVGKEYPGYIIPNAGGDLNDPSFIYSRLLSGACECNWASEEFDELYTKGIKSNDEAERAEIYQQMQEIVSQERPILISIHAPMITATQSNVSGAWVTPSGDLRLEAAQISME